MTINRILNVTSNCRKVLLGWLILAGVSLIASGFTSAEESSLAQAINTSGRQRMLAQRIVKSYAQIGQEITPQVSRRQLDDAVRLFETQLKELKGIAPDRLSRRSVERLEKLWRPFKLIATGPVSRDGAERLLAIDDKLVSAAHEVTLELQDRSQSASGRLVNISGRQRMLCQRLAKYYLLRAWGLDSPAISREIGSARAEFDGALATLRSAAENTEEIRRELDAVAMQWEWFQNALAFEGAASYGLIVINASEAILGSMELITNRYERLPAR